jgi:hypothetical protein
MVLYERKAISLLLLSREPGSASPALTILTQCYNPSIGAVCRSNTVTIPRLAYRSRQFWNALLSSRKRIMNESLLPHLTPAQLVLFRRMQPSEQWHAYQVLKHLKTDGQTNPDLLKAALLHDVGKILQPLSIFDRIRVVLGKRFFQDATRRWADGPARGLHMPYVVSKHHAEWGADLASQTGANSQTVELIRRHQDPPLPHPASATEQLLAVLQAADDES